MAAFAQELGKPADVKLWRARAARRKAAIEKYLWDPAQNRYTDYDVVAKTHSPYLYATAFYPLWAGIATPKQAASTVLTLQQLENDHGLAMSDRNTGQQWDKPFGWAPNHYFAILGLRQYGYTADADRLASKFRNDVESNYLREGTIREKYDVLTGSTTTRGRHRLQIQRHRLRLDQRRLPPPAPTRRPTELTLTPKNCHRPKRSPPKDCHFDRSEAKWRNPLSSTRPKTVISTEAKRSGEIRFPSPAPELSLRPKRSAVEKPAFLHPANAPPSLLSWRPQRNLPCSVASSPRSLSPPASPPSPSAPPHHPPLPVV